MTRTVSATEAKVQILSLLDEVAAGDEVVITKHGKVVARLVGAGSPRSSRGCAEGMARTNAGENELFHTDTQWNLSSDPDQATA